jgi:hypothetical protein
MEKLNGLDGRNLQIQLEIYRLILDVHPAWKGESIFAKDELAEKLELAQSYMNESHQRGELDDQTKSYDALSNAKTVIVEVGAVIERLLYPDSCLADCSGPKNLDSFLAFLRR